MAQLLAVLARGPGLLIIALVAVIAVAVPSRDASSSHAQAVAPTRAPLSTPSAPPPALPTAGTTAAPTSTPATPAPTPLPPAAAPAAPAYTVHVAWQRPFVDPWWRTWGAITGVRLSPSSARHSLDVLLAVRLQHRGRRIVHYAHRNFFAFTNTGHTYPTRPLGSGLPALRWGSLGLTGAAQGWIRLTMPLASMIVTVVWNDHNHLRTPVPILQLDVRPLPSLAGAHHERSPS